MFVSLPSFLGPITLWQKPLGQTTTMNLTCMGRRPKRILPRQQWNNQSQIFRSRRIVSMSTVSFDTECSKFSLCCKIEGIISVHVNRGIRKYFILLPELFLVLRCIGIINDVVLVVLSKLTKRWYIYGFHCTWEGGVCLHVHVSLSCDWSVPYNTLKWLTRGFCRSSYEDHWNKM